MMSHASNWDCQSFLLERPSSAVLNSCYGFFKGVSSSFEKYLTSCAIDPIEDQNPIDFSGLPLIELKLDPLPEVDPKTDSN